MKVYVKRQVAIESDGEPARMLQLIESTREKIKQLEYSEKAIAERLSQATSFASWLRFQLSSGELILRDAPKIDEAEKDAALHTATLKKIASSLKREKASLVKLIESFNRQWLEIEASDEIK